MKPILLLLLSLLLRTTNLIAQDALHLLFTGGINGYIRSEEAQYHGDAVRVAATVQAIVERDTLNPESVLFVDTGDMLSYHYLSRVDSGATVLNTLVQAGLQAGAVGNLDFAYGATNLERLSQAHPDFTFLATNVTAGSGQLFLATHKIVRKNGYAIGIVGVLAPDMQQSIHTERLQGLQLKPVMEALTKVVAQIRHDCDLIVAVNHLDFDANLRLARQIDALDVIISAPGRQPVRDLVQIHGLQNQLKSTVVMAAPRARSVGHLTVTMSSTHDSSSVTAVKLREYVPTGQIPESELDYAAYQRLEQAYRQYTQREYGVLPDDPLGATGPDFQQDIADLALYTMLKSTHSEIALLNNGIFRFAPFDTGGRPLTVRDIERIVWQNNHVVTVRLSGAQLKTILKRSRLNYAAGDSRYLRYLAVRDYDRQREATIHGVPLQDDEIYAVVTTDFLAAGGDGYRTFRQGTHRRSRFRGQTRIEAESGPKGARVSIRELMVRFLRSSESPNLSSLQTWFSRSSYMNRPLWLLQFSDIMLSLRDVQVHNNEALTEVKDSRVNAETDDVFNLAAGGRIALIRRTRQLRWENGIALRHARTKIAGGDLFETEDDIEIGAILDVYRVPRLPDKLNVFSSLRYETELTPTQDVSGADNPRRKDLYLSGGFSFFGERFVEARLAYFGKFDFVKENLNSGVELNARYTTQWGILLFDSAVRTRYLVSNANPSAGDELGSIDWKNSIGISLTENLSLRPGLDIFVFRDRVIRESAVNMQLSLNLSYSRIWKPQYLKFRRTDSR